MNKKVEVKNKNYVLAIEYINGYATNIYDVRIFSSKKEVDDCIKEHNCTPIQYLDKLRIGYKWLLQQ